MNKIILLGRLTSDPIIQYSQNGTAYTRFAIAVNREQEGQVDFFNCTSFGKTAVAIADYCQKGRQVLLEGRVEINAHNTENGKRHYVTVIVSQIQFLVKPQSNQQGGYQESNSQSHSNSNSRRTNGVPYEQQQFQSTADGWRHPS